MLAAMAVMALVLAPTASASNVRTYEVTITNGTGGQPFTPPLASTHEKSADVYDLGKASSYELKEIAENGNLAPMFAERTGNSKVFDVFQAAGPIGPRGELTFTIDAEGGAKWFSSVSMLVCTNDGFTGVDSVKLPKNVGDRYSVDLNAYETSTEANTENLADIVPPCSDFETGTGKSNANLVQQGVIGHHPGITGTGSIGALNLTPAAHGWEGAVGSITITRTG
jgi:hypothetical protein